MSETTETKTDVFGDPITVVEKPKLKPTVTEFAPDEVEDRPEQGAPKERRINMLSAQGAPPSADRMMITVKTGYLKKLVKSVVQSLAKCTTIADAVKARDSMEFLGEVRRAGLSLEDVGVSAEIIDFMNAYL